MSVECPPTARRPPTDHGCSRKRLARITFNLHIGSEVGGLLAHFTDEESEAWPASGSRTWDWGLPEAKLLSFPAEARDPGTLAWEAKLLWGLVP